MPVGQLTAYRIVLSALEARLATSADETVAAIWLPELAKVSLLDRDLAFFSSTPAGECLAETVAAAEQFAMVIHHHEPVALLGFLYVFEGATLGSLELARHVRSAYRLPDGRGLAYYSSGDRLRWTGFRSRMNAALVDEPQQEAVVAAAGTAYRWLAGMLRTLSPVGASL